MTYFVEIRTAVRRRHAPRLVPLDQVDQYTGFRSVFGFDEATAQRIREQGGTSGLRNCEVFADTLFMDFDSHRPDQFLEWLGGSGLAHTVWDSGGRSVHVHIPMQPVFGAWVPRACKLWVKQHASTADVSFYSPAGIYRLPGTYHAKHPGRCKVLEYERPGEALVLTAPADERFRPSQSAEITREVFYTTLLQAVAEGGRQPRAWLLATMAAECGMEFGEAVEHLLWWNNHMCLPPHAPDTIIKQVESAYRRLAREA